jgi:3-isopropylmalate/(R)-2-methylmalate dehydratase small subunit
MRFERITSTLIVLPIDNIDTDQIIPARFLKTTTREGLGEKLFHDWRYDRDGKARSDFALSSARPGASVLLAGSNFGCGSSREHAPWALYDYGIRVVIAPSFADIFRANAAKNGILTVEVTREFAAFLLESQRRVPGLEVTIDLQAQALSAGGITIEFSFDAFSRQCLLHGRDELDYLLSHMTEVEAYENAHAGS